MKKKKTKVTQVTATESHPFENKNWATLTDIQKAQLLLGTTRLLDVDTFKEQYGSFEEPTINSLPLQS